MTFFRKLALAGTLSLTIGCAAMAQQVTVETNKSKPLRINGKASSVVIGNPNVADVAVHSENLLFITGRTFGSTNLLIFNEAGEQLYSGDIVVTSNTQSFLTVNRAGQNNTYDCAPHCRSVLAVGDEPEYFQNLLTQNETLRENASGE